MIAYKIRMDSTIEYVKDEDRVSTNSYNWDTLDCIYM
jgi:hypothetical protein